MAGTPVKSCITTRAGVKAISSVWSAVAFHVATASICSARDPLAVLVAEEVLEQDLERVGQAGDVVLLLQGVEAEDLVIGATHAEGGLGVKGVAGHASNRLPRWEVESVWDYPRPPRVEQLSLPVRVELGGEVVADEPAGAARARDQPSAGDLRPARRRGARSARAGPRALDDVRVEGPRRLLRRDRRRRRVEPAAAWAYPEPVPGFEALRDHLAFYPSRMDACWIGDERVQAQDGDFYGGWITSQVRGPFKGGPGTWGW